MKIKLKDLVDAFEAITKIYDSIEKFSRKWELVEPYKELKEAVKLFDEKRKSLMPPLDENGKMPVKDYNEYDKKISAILDTEIELKKPFRFSKKELEDSKIKGSEILLVMEFLNPKS